MLAPPVSAESPGQAGFRVTEQPGAGHRMPFDNCPYMNGHRDLQATEILRDDGWKMRNWARWGMTGKTIPDFLAQIYVTPLMVSARN